MTVNVKAFPSDIILGRGEQKEIQLKAGDSFSLGNSQVISKKVYKNHLLIKGKSIGFSDLKVLRGKNVVFDYKIYVLPKKQELSFIGISDALKEINLTPQILGEKIKITGTINHIDHYYFLERIISNYKNQIINEIQLNQKIKNQIIASYYEQFQNLGIEFHFCKMQDLMVYCYLPKTSEVDQKIHELFPNRLLTIFYKKNKPKNLKIKLKLIQIENLKGKDFTFGLDQINTNFQNLFEKGVESFIEENKIILSQKNLEAKSIAEPEGIIAVGESLNFEVGSEIPFRADNQFTINTQWKFAGLKIKLKLDEMNNQYWLQYDTELTLPHENAISGSKTNGKLLAQTDYSQSLFQIHYETDSKQESGIPLIKDIPLIGRLFRGTSKLKTYKQLVGIIQINEGIDDVSL